MAKKDEKDELKRKRMLKGKATVKKKSKKIAPKKKPAVKPAEKPKSKIEKPARKKKDIKEWMQEKKEALELKLAAVDVDLIDEIEKVTAGVKIPEFSLENHFVLKTKPDPQISTINTPKLGLVGGKNPYRSQVKNALRDAEVRGVDAVVITGNLEYIDTKRFSNLSALRSKISGVKTRPELVEDKEAADKLKKGKPVFLSFKEKFDHLMEIIKDTFTENGKPIFSGQTLIFFGNTEESLAVYYANEKMNKAVAEERYRLGARIQVLKHLIKEEKNEETKNFHCAELVKTLKRQKIIKGTSLNEEFKNDCRDEMTKYIVYRLEQAIPNAKVISVGECAIRLDSPKAVNCKTIGVFHKPTESIHDTSFADFVDNKYQAIAGGVIPQPDVCVLGGLNLDMKQQSISYAVLPVDRKADFESTESSVKSVDVIQLPTCIDGEFIKKFKEQGVRYADPLMQFASSEGFDSGAVVLRWVDGIFRVEKLPQDYLGNEAIFGSKEALQKVYSESNVIYGEQEGDCHIGHQFVARYKIREFPWEIYHYQLVHKILLENDAPICFYFNTGDTINAQNYPTWEEQHPEKLFPYKWFRVIQEISAKGDSWKDRFDRLSSLVVRDSRISGIISPERQFKEYFRTAIESDICPAYVKGLEYWTKMLERAKRIGLKNFGDLGIITFIEGQHSAHTFEGKIRESDQIATHLRIALRRHGFTEKEVSKWVRAPMYGTYSLAEGLLGVAPEMDSEKKALLSKGKPYFYCFIAQHKPAAGRGIYKGKDKARSIKLHQSRKGTTQAYQQGRFVVRLGGDIHLLILSFSKNTLDVVSGSQTFYDAWRAYLGLALNNIVTVILGLPKNGPSTGPISTIFLRYEELLDYVRNPWPIDFKKLFRNAMG